MSTAIPTGIRRTNASEQAAEQLLLQAIYQRYPITHASQGALYLAMTDDIQETILRRMARSIMRDRPANSAPLLRGTMPTARELLKELDDV